jgi:hypothetical protein
MPSQVMGTKMDSDQPACFTNHNPGRVVADREKPPMLVFHNVYFRLLRLKVKILIPVFAAVFVGVIFWQVFLNYLMN